MQNEQSSEEVQEFFVSLREFIDNVEESDNNEKKISDVLSLFKSIIEYLEADNNVSSHQNDLLSNLNESLQATVKVATEFEERITKLENMITDIASNSMRLAEETAKIPVIDIENLLKTLNEHSDEINENTSSIKLIKDELKI